MPVESMDSSRLNLWIQAVGDTCYGGALGAVHAQCDYLGVWPY